MTWRVRYTRAARDDLLRMYDFLLQHDIDAARQALTAIENAVGLLEQFPFTCRKASPDNPFLRELVISFGSSGYVALYEIEADDMVTILAVRHQREDDYH